MLVADDADQAIGTGPMAAEITTKLAQRAVIEASSF